MDRSHVYFIRVCKPDGAVKIGVSFTPETRLKAVRASCPDAVEIAALIVGTETLERRFHASFKSSHMHHEWFAASDRLADTIAQISAGIFDVETLPAPLDIRPKPKWTAAAIEAGKNARRVTFLEKRGVIVPGFVRAATSTYGIWGAELERRRAIVAEWVQAHDARQAEAA